MEPWDYPPVRPPRRAPWVVLTAILGLIAVALAAVIVVIASHRIVAGSAVKAAGESWTYAPMAPPTPASPRTPGGPPAAPGQSPLPTANPPHDGASGPLGGPTFGPGDQLYHFNPPQLPFEFDLPQTWGCMHLKDDPLDFKLTCMDEKQKGGPAGWIGINRCAAPCGASEQSAVRSKLAIAEQNWKAVDPNTWYARVTGTLQNGERVVRVAMTCAYPSGAPDHLAIAVITGHPDSEDTLQKIANEIRMRIPA